MFPTCLAEARAVSRGVPCVGADWWWGLWGARGRLAWMSELPVRGQLIRNPGLAAAAAAVACPQFLRAVVQLAVL